MAAVKGRSRRHGVSDTVLLQARVARERRAKAGAVADALGVSIAAYIDGLLAHDELDELGRPLWWTANVAADQQELPMKTA